MLTPSIPSSSGKRLKVVMIPIFQGMEALHILRTDVFATLAAHEDVRVALLFPTQSKIDHYKKEFPESERLIYVLSSGYQGGPLETFLAKAKVWLLRTETMDIKRQLKRVQGGSAFRYYLSLLGNRILARRPVRALARVLDRYAVREAFYRPLFDTYRPDLVFLAHLFSDAETAILREAKRRGVASVGFVNSWDKLTSRSILRIIPDHLIVPNEITAAEARRYHDVPQARIVVSGPPQFDVYKKLTPTPRDAFCRALGIDPAKRLILFCPVGKAFSGMDWGVIQFLDKAIGDGTLPADLHVLVRFPPNDTVEERGGVEPSRFTFIRPGTRFSALRGIDWDMAGPDQQTLVDDLYHAELVVCSFSTMSIDSAVLDKPVINLDFAVESKKLFHRMYERTHYQHILATGGVRLVKNERALAEAITDYLAHSERDAEGRKRIREEQLWKLDGEAGRRVGEYLLQLL